MDYTDEQLAEVFAQDGETLVSVAHHT